MKLKLLLGLLLIGVLSVKGQGEIREDFQGLSLEQIRRELISSYGAYMYFDPSWGESFTLKSSSLNLPLTDLIDSIAQQTGLQYHFRGEKEIVFSKGKSLQPFLAEDFWNFEAEEASPDKAQDFFEIPPPERSQFTPIEEQVISIGNTTPGEANSSKSIGGYIRDGKTGEPLIGASVFVPSLSIGTTTDNFGYYVLNLPPGEHRILFRYVGKKETSRKINLLGSGQLDLELEDEILSLKEIVISGEKSQLESVQTGAVRLNLGEINTIPTVLGEADIMKITLNLPGVQSIGEGASGFHVRGGSNDQNLILLNKVPVYNPHHLFGFFSAFNPQVIKYAELFKSGIRAQYGGRASSVFDIAIREGNRNKLILSGGISPVTAKANLEGPLLGKKGSFVLGLRTTFANWLLQVLENPQLRNSRAYFGDVIGNITLPINDKNNLTISGYYSQDRFRLDADTLYQYSNANASIRWRKTYSNQLSSLLTLGYSGYQFSLESLKTPSNAFFLDYSLGQSTGKIDFDYYPSFKHHITFGIQSSLYALRPGSIQPVGDESGIGSTLLNRERGLENAIYAGDEITLSNRFSLYGGLRFTNFSTLGPGDVFLYEPNLPRESNFIVDTLSISSGKRIKTYNGLDYHFSARYKLNSQLSAKMSYDKSRQFIHMLTNTIAVSPIDTWRLSNTYLSPQVSDQLAVGIYKGFQSSSWELSLEGYVKKLQNLLEYQDGADLLINETLEADVLPAEGRAFGIEVLLKKKTGQLNGWVSYTFSRTRLRVDSPFEEERINQGDWYPANYDIPHNLAIISNYKVNRRVNFSLNLTYRTGRPTTVPIAQYQFRNNVLAFFSKRNQYRVPDYFRADFAINIEGNHRVEKLGHSSWSFSIYNLTGRNNVYSVFSRLHQERIQTFQLSIFARPVISLTYNFRLQ